MFAISGLHIGLVAGLGWLAGRWCGHTTAGLLVALMLATGYAWLAGFGVATQRALLMLVIWLGLMAWGRLWSGRRILLLTMTLLLLVNPWLALNQGFWLSAGRWRPCCCWRRACAAKGYSGCKSGWDWCCCPGNGTVWWPELAVGAGERGADPAVFTAVDSAVIAGLWPAVIESCGGGAGIRRAERAFGPLMGGLHWLAAQASPWVVLPAFAQAVVWLALLLPLLALLPQARSFGLALGWLALLLLWPGPAWQVRVLDVGQGLSVLVTQGQRALLYDTGNRFRSGFNMADGVILPLFHRLGIDALDYLVISHDDSDHSANRDYLATQVPVRHRWGAWPGACPAGPANSGSGAGSPCACCGRSHRAGTAITTPACCIFPTACCRCCSTGDIEQAAERGLLAAVCRSRLNCC
ncbi:ComEC/Rec2 family competence protein [Oceanimonas sp. NS1]|nr:ComEC/Rec2 family competence protein [Oceanimonas sp. NS1]